MSDQKIKRICLWSCPRNISTATMYSFAQRKDTKVFDEPLYGYYLKQTNAASYHPGAKEIINSMESNGNAVIDMMLKNREKPVLFFKNMTHHLLDLDTSFLKEVTNVLLTRDPKDMIPSFNQVIKNPTMQDVGYAAHTKILKKLDNLNAKTIVLDSTQTLKNPEIKLKKLCDFIGIPFDKNMLSWKAGAIPEDGIWAKYWYSNVHKSTGFQKYVPKKKNIPEQLLPLLEECIPHYEILKKRSI
ncbi:sulfotransferase family protein [Zunongwangia sp. HRR-M8]|uniref:sulfotransferase-like domain-containing protein n=1 Tax=Zunongwangia sp. HRR-M8 TaxID=3015170 RepID=UPI0022DE387E|nr:sulfotransferase family protein [Zunongwangia sp. HRR-M8]WBL23454.1 sulfotransferase family protein [Zunongwangia sp. HRR-M8]